MKKILSLLVFLCLLCVFFLGQGCRKKRANPAPLGPPYTLQLSVQEGTASPTHKKNIKEVGLKAGVLYALVPQLIARSHLPQADVIDKHQVVYGVEITRTSRGGVATQGCVEYRDKAATMNPKKMTLGGNDVRFSYPHAKDEEGFKVKFPVLCIVPNMPLVSTYTITVRANIGTTLVASFSEQVTVTK